MEDEDEDEDDLEELTAPLQDHSSSTPEKLWATPLSKGQRLVGSHPLETGLLRSEWAEVDCSWVKALDQQSDSRLDGSDHSSIDPWVNAQLTVTSSTPVFHMFSKIYLRWWFRPTLGQVWGLRSEGLIVWFESLGSSDSICWVELEVFFLVRLGLSLYYHVDYQKVCHVSCCHRLEDSTSHPDSVRSVKLMRFNQLLVFSEFVVDDE
ncbi:hypothetical protein PPACK8108_LOCUS10814 [Phakopsora pachyrhizi]|uniref:Uncharacterized protein n=1 Tax=Phakopsora pachyrhizi TaxID=170000 RepID=A0AAV0B0R3_PHAPC|nr:hypothetical protein PPACK8108_LOCUS10814 [Phakopsora pachyrhizi]